NTEFQLANTMIYSYSFTDKLGVNITGSYVKARNYFGRILDDVYELSQEVAYSFTPALTVGLGHSNGGQLMNNQLGADRDIQIYDGRNDSYYVYLFYTF